MWLVVAGHRSVAGYPLDDLCWLLRTPTARRMILLTTRRIFRNNLLIRNYTRKASVIGSSPDRSTPEYQVGHSNVQSTMDPLIW